MQIKEFSRAIGFNNHRGPLIRRPALTGRRVQPLTLSGRCRQAAQLAAQLPCAPRLFFFLDSRATREFRRPL